MFDCVHPSPCGHFGDSQKACTCAPAVVTKYQKRISGPLLDRIDIHIEVPRVDYEKLSGNKLGETSEVIRKRVQTARDIQTQRCFEYSQLEYRSIEYRLQCRYAYRGSQAILPTPTRRSEFDAGGDESIQFIGACVSPHPQIIPHHRRFGGERRDTVLAFGRGTTISSEVDAGVMKIGYQLCHSRLVE